jgi:hypothetical protein
MTGSQPDFAVLNELYKNRLEMVRQWAVPNFPGALGLWNYLGSQLGQLQPTLIERLALAELFAYVGDDATESSLGVFTQEQPVLAHALRAVWLSRHGQRQRASAELVEALHLYRSDPWPLLPQLARALSLMQLTAAEDRELVPSWLEALSRPFAAYVSQATRERTRINLAIALGPNDPTCVGLLAQQEPNVEWSETVLGFRAACYAAHGHPLRELAERELAEWHAAAPVPFARLLR